MARVQSGMAIQEKGPVRDAALRRGLQMNHGRSIDDAIRHAHKALEINPTYVPGASPNIDGLIGAIIPQTR